MQTYHKKLFFTFFFFGVLFIGITLYSSFYISKSSIEHVAIENAKDQLYKNRTFLKLFIDNIQVKLIALKDSKIFQRHIQKDGYNDEELEDLFLTIAESDNFIMQLRLLNLQGDEIIRVNRNVCYAVPYLELPYNLQNKKDRYYFKKITDLPNNMFWLSKLDLNVEHGKIEKPYKPVLRTGTPVYKDEKKVGIIIVNYFMKKALDTLASTKLYNIYLVDKDGYFILHPNKAYNFSRYLNKNITLKNFFKDYKKILTQNEYQGDRFYSATINLPNGEDIKMIVELTDAFLATNLTKTYHEIAYLFILLVIITVALSLYFSKPYTKLQKELQKLNQNLENEVKNKTKELQELNQNLEQKVIERTKDQDVLLSLFDLGDAVLFKWRNDDAWSVAYVSKSVEKLLGYSPEEFLEGKIAYADLIYKEDLERVTKEVEEAIAKKLYFFTHEPYRITTKNKKTKWIHDNTVIVRNEDGEIEYFVGYLIDITEIKESELKMQHLSITDKLTNIYNRLFLDQILKKQYYELLRNGEQCSIIMMDIDYFKKINDKYGHLVGDSVLQELSQLIKKNIRESDVFGRWGGEEFMIIAPHTNKEEAVILAEKLRKLIESHNFKGVEHLTVSFGVTECKANFSLDRNILNADKALYTSKGNGRNQVSIA